MATQAAPLQACYTQAALTETWEETHYLVQRITNDFYAKYRKDWRVDFRELQSVANEAFCIACHTYRWDETRDFAFSTWLWWQVWGRLMTHLTKEYRLRQRYLLPEKVPDSTREEQRELKGQRIRTNPNDLGKELSPDAAFVLKLIAEPARTLGEAMDRPRIKVAAVLDLLREALLDYWKDALRVDSALREIRDAL